MKMNYTSAAFQWKGESILLSLLSKTAMAKYWRLRKGKSINGKFPPVLCEKAQNGYFLFVPPEWGGDELEYKIEMEKYANTEGVMLIV